MGLKKGDAVTVGLRIYCVCARPTGRPTEESTKRDGEDRDGERESDPVEMKNDFRSYGGSRQPPLTRFRYSVME